jgi:ABC-type phosphate/phosphonate transport system substrate-binding protein
VLKNILAVCTISLAGFAAPFVNAAPNGDNAPPGDTGVSTTIRKVSYTPASIARSEPAVNRLGDQGVMDGALVFSAPPRETLDEANRIYLPITQYLSRVIGKKVEYRHPDNWLRYQTEMLKGGYDIVFDGPHLNSWRITNLRHNALAKLADEQVIAVIVRKGDSRINDLKQLVGKGICSLDPPDLGALAVLAQYDNPMRVPAIIDSPSPTAVYDNVSAGKRCVAGILPVANLMKLDAASRQTRVIFRTKPMPNQAFSAGPRVSAEDQAKIAAALLSPEATGPTEALRASFGATTGFAPAIKSDYAGLDSYLKDAWAYTR